MTDITQVRTWLAGTSTVRSYLDMHDKFITHRPTYVLPVVSQVVRPNLWLET
jgi:hypothetical protein